MTVTISAALLRTGELAADLGARAAMSLDRRILEVDEDTEAYGRGHIPGALAVHWKHDLQDPVRRDFIGPEAFAALMDRLGIDNDTQVVLYGGNSNWFAAYTHWYFRYYGHRAVRARRWPQDLGAGGPTLTTEVPEVASGMGYRVGGPVEEIRALRGQVQEAIGNGGARPWSTSAPRPSSAASSWPRPTWRWSSATTRAGSWPRATSCDEAPPAR